MVAQGRIELPTPCADLVRPVQVLAGLMSTSPVLLDVAKCPESPLAENLLRTAHFWLGTAGGLRSGINLRFHPDNGFPGRGTVRLANGLCVEAEIRADVGEFFERNGEIVGESFLVGTNDAVEKARSCAGISVENVDCEARGEFTIAQCWTVKAVVDPQRGFVRNQ